MKKEIKTVMGMELMVWEHRNCEVQISEFPEDSTATIYLVESKNPGQGIATEMLSYLKGWYEGQGMTLYSSVALNDRMKRILKKLDIPEYE
jgi:hypothetical protein